MFLEAPYKTFLEYHFNKNGIELNEETLKLIEKVCEFQEAEHGTKVGRDAITITEDDDEIAAESLKFYNLVNIDITKAAKSIAKGAGSLIEGEELGIIFALLSIAKDFYGNLKYNFTESDAKVLLAIFHLKTIAFTIEDVKISYKNVFDEELIDETANDGIVLFKALRVIKLLNENTYQLREKISYVRV